jgi:3,4-dihydroxyphenylacetate 2,3-dioxygenase
MSNQEPGVIATVIASHTPRMAYEDKAWDFTLGLIDGLKEMGVSLRAMKPDLIVVNTTHWISTFDWFATAHDHHEGVCIAEEAPHLIPGLSYNRPGDRAFAEAMVEDWHAGDLPAYTVETPHFHWDYGSAIPLQYLDPDATIPAVLTPTCYASDIDENIKVGELLDETAKRMNKRVILVVSNALTHLIVRGPDKWPLDEHIAMDHKFIDMIKEADVDGALDYLPEYARDAKCEMGGRGLGVFLGAARVLQNKSGDLSGAMYGPYAQSSGSGNANLSLVPAK